MVLHVACRADDADKHEFDVNYLLFHKGKLYSAADDGKVKVWQPDLKFVGEIQAHPCSVFCLTVDDDTLYSCSNEGTIKAWDLNTLSEKKTIIKDESVEFWRVCYSNGCLFSGDDKGNVTVFKNGTVYGSLNVAEPIKDMVVKDNLLYTVKDLDLTITMVQTESDKLQYGIKSVATGRAPINLAGDKFFVTSRDGRDILVHDNSLDTKFKQVSEIKEAHSMIINALAAQQINGNHILYSGGWDKVIKQWKIENGKPNNGENCNVDIVINTLTVGENGQIYAAGADGHIVRLDN